MTTWSDEVIVEAVKRYREENQGLYGPPSLDALSDYMARMVGENEGPTKSALSNRLHRLIVIGKLEGDVISGELKSFTLRPVEDGDDAEPA